MTSRSAWSRLAAAIAAAACVNGSCGRGSLAPAALDTRNDACQTCRMTVSEARFAAQLVAPGEDVRFFDDIGCLVKYLDAHAAGVEQAVAYVADHRTKEWVTAARAVYVRVPRIETPMGSHIVAHADVASRQQDPDTAEGTALTVTDVFGRSGPPALGLREREYPR